MLTATWSLCNSRLELVMFFRRDASLLRKKGRESLRVDVAASRQNEM